MNTQIISIIIGIIPTAICVYLTYELFKLKKKFDQLTSSYSDQNLQTIVEKYVKTLDKCGTDIEMMNNEFAKIRQETSEFLRKVGLVRFQAFKDTGGDQSFSLAVLDQNNNGFIISTLHGRGFSKVYSKEITEGQSTQHKLTDEEQQALQKALEK